MPILILFAGGREGYEYYSSQFHSGSDGKAKHPMLLGVVEKSPRECGRLDKKIEDALLINWCSDVQRHQLLKDDTTCFTQVRAARQCR